MWTVIGHERTVTSLQRAIGTDRLPHALVFTGPSGIGKTTLALELAKALECTGANPPCQACVHCRQIASGSHPDVAVIEPPEGKTSIVIEQVRDLRDAAALRPFQGRVKVYVISGAEALTAQAADALLKTLEEPQPQVRLILTAVDLDGLPATIVSRCRVEPLGPVDAPAIAAALRREGMDGAEAERVSRLARGSIGWAFQALARPALVSTQEDAISRLTGLWDYDVAERLRLAETLTADRKDRSALRRQLELLVLIARDLLLLSTGRPAALVIGDEQNRLRAQAARIGFSRIITYLDRLRLTMDRVDQNVDPRLALEALFLNLP
jgi:DNA polymerase-3 subunit delta'